MRDYHPDWCVETVIRGDNVRVCCFCYVDKDILTVTDDDGNIIIADGDLYKYNPEGRLIEVIRMPERPACIVYGGRDGKSLYVTTRGSFYRVRHHFLL